MNDISIYFEPISTSGVKFEEGSLGELNSVNERSFPELKKGDVAFFYVPEYRGINRETPIEGNRDTFRFDETAYWLIAVAPVQKLVTVKVMHSIFVNVPDRSQSVDC